MKTIDDPTEIKVLVTCQVSPHDPDEKFDISQLCGCVAQAIHNAVEMGENAGFSHPMADAVSIGIADVEALDEDEEQSRQDEAEEQRRDEKKGLYPDRKDMAN